MVNALLRSVQHRESDQKHPGYPLKQFVWGSKPLFPE